MKNKTYFTQVCSCDNDHEVNKLLDLEWILIETVSINYEDGDGFIRTMMGNINEKIEMDELRKILGRRYNGPVFPKTKQEIFGA